MKYVAYVKHVLHAIHRIGTLHDGEIQCIADMPLPHRIEIELEDGPEKPYMMYRYTESGEFCGDTWHLTLRDAIEQAGYEYGLAEHDFSLE
jgi:hypothetical protein